MKASVSFAMATLLSLLSIPAMAQRGASSARSAPARSGRVFTAPAPRSNFQPQRQAYPRFSNAPVNTFRSSTPARSINPVSRPFVSAPQASGQSRINYGGGHRIWWGGGLYFGVWVGPGWYYPGLIYPGYWYGNGWLSYQYNFGPYLASPGIKFDLSQISAGDRKAVENGGVYLPDQKGERGYLGAVKNFSGVWHKALPLDPGTHDLVVALEDGREIQMNVTVQSQRITNVTLRFDKEPAAEKQPADTAAGNNPPTLVPAPQPK